MRQVVEFVNIYRQYRKVHSVRYSLTIAWGCAFRGLPF